MIQQLPEIVKPKLDIIFKRIFGDKRNKNIIIRFLADILEIPHNSIKEIYIENGELIPEYSEEKFSRLDIKLELKDANDSENQIINIEMQVNSEPAFKERTLFYWSKIYSEELKSSEEYDYLKKTICINIINFNLFTSPEYQSHFQILEKDRKELLTDKFSTSTVAFPVLPPSSSLASNTAGVSFKYGAISEANLAAEWSEERAFPKQYKLKDGALEAIATPSAVKIRPRGAV